MIRMKLKKNHLIITLGFYEHIERYTVMCDSKIYEQLAIVVNM